MSGYGGETVHQFSCVMMRKGAGLPLRIVGGQAMRVPLHRTRGAHLVVVNEQLAIVEQMMAPDALQ